MKSFFAIAVTVALTMTASAQAGQSSPNNGFAEDKKAISSVVKQFEQAIINKDKPAFMSLFVKKNVSWIGIYDEPTMAYRKELIAKLPEDKRVAISKQMHSSPSEFIDSIVESKSQNRETFDNVRITTNGDIASVYFDYAYYMGDYKNNWGSEAWHLVKTVNGWRINSVIFSMTFNSEQLESKE